MYRTSETAEMPPVRRLAAMAACLALALALAAFLSAASAGTALAEGLAAGSAVQGAEPAVLHGGETIEQSGCYVLDRYVRGTITIGEGLDVTVDGRCYDHEAGKFVLCFNDFGFAVGDGSTLTIKDVYVRLSEYYGNLVDFAGDGSLLIEGCNVFDRPDGYGPSAVIHVGYGSSVHFGGTGALYGYKHAMGAFIGADGYEANGEITFDSGTWFVKGSKTGSLIGSDSTEVKGGDITVNGGAIYCKGVARGACMGSSPQGIAPNVTVNGGLMEFYCDFSGSAIGSGGAHTEEGGGGQGSGSTSEATLTVNGGSIKCIVSINASGNWLSDYWGDTPKNQRRPMVSDRPLTATHTTKQLAFDASRYAGGTVSVEVDGRPFYTGGLYEWCSAENKNPDIANGQPTTLSNWVPNTLAYRVPDDAQRDASMGYPTEDYGSFLAGDQNLYFQLEPADHVLVCNGDVYQVTWDGDAGAFSCGFDAQATVDLAVAAIPDASDEGFEAAVEAALAVYGSLDDAQRAQLSGPGMAALFDAQQKLAAAELAAAEQGRLTAEAAAAAQGERAKAAESALAARAAEVAAAQAREAAAQVRAQALEGQLSAAKAQAAQLAKGLGTAKAARGLKANPMTAKAKTVKAKAGKKKTVKRSKAFTVKGAKGKVTFYKLSGDENITVTKAGKVKVKAGLKAKKKAYRVKVLVCAAGDKDHAPAFKTVTLKVKVR